jgi:hypothetical protein
VLSSALEDVLSSLDEVLQSEKQEKQSEKREQSAKLPDGWEAGEFYFHPQEEGVTQEKKYWVKVPEDVPDWQLYDFVCNGNVEKAWELGQPPLILSVVGDSTMERSWARNAIAMRRCYFDHFVHGVRSIVKTTNAWLISEGTDYGMVKLIGDVKAISDTTSPFIGFCDWDMVPQKQELSGENDEVEGQPRTTYSNQYSGDQPTRIHRDPSMHSLHHMHGSQRGPDSPRVEPDSVKNQARLEYNHTHFIFIEAKNKPVGGISNGWDGATARRQQFETFLCKQDPERRELSSRYMNVGVEGTNKGAGDESMRKIPTDIDFTTLKQLLVNANMPLHKWAPDEVIKGLERQQYKGVKDLQREVKRTTTALYDGRPSIGLLRVTYQLVFKIYADGDDEHFLVEQQDVNAKGKHRHRPGLLPRTKLDHGELAHDCVAVVKAKLLNEFSQFGVAEVGAQSELVGSALHEFVKARINGTGARVLSEADITVNEGTIIETQELMDSFSYPVSGLQV